MLHLRWLTGFWIRLWMSHLDVTLTGQANVCFVKTKCFHSFANNLKTILHTIFETSAIILNIKPGLKTKGGQGAMPLTFSEITLLQICFPENSLLCHSPRDPKPFWPQHSQNLVGGTWKLKRFHCGFFQLEMLEIFTRA